jgi:DNA-binding Xre family transcriptional regulator
MSISYKGLWKILDDKKLLKKDLSSELKISSATIAKMGKGESVSLDVLQRICQFLGCNIGDIVSFEKNSDIRE